ncbi:MAG: acetyl-CoA carboxylase biotin carboxyl carrier protein [Pseudomonadota bacterium]
MSSNFKVDAEAIRELAHLLDETGLSEIEIEDTGRRLRVARGMTSVPVAAAPASAPAAQSSEAAAPAAPAAGDAELAGAVASPMVGTAYLAPEPGAAPFVKAGDSVAEGDTLLIIEAMKVMNPIRAPHSGTVERVLIENGSPIEYGQPLIVLA